MVTQRRIFQAKPGALAEVVARMKEFQIVFKKHGGPQGRLYTDPFSGHTDQVVWELIQRAWAT